MTLKPHINREHLFHLLTQMVRIRRFEERCAELYSQEKIRGFLHLYIGEEAVAVGAITALKPEDYLVATYREHGHALVRGVSMSSMMAEMYGKSNGCSKGRGGSMHIFDAESRFYGGNAIVGGGLPMAVGLAMAIKKMQKEQAVAVCFFGEGAVAEGEFHESMNLAALWQLPVLFICENNRYAMGTALEISESQQDIASKALAYGMTSVQVDGMNVVDVEAAVVSALEGVREQQTPCLIECLTYRFRGHSMFDSQRYRSREEVIAHQKEDPIDVLKQWLADNKLLNEADWTQLNSSVAAEVDQAVHYAEEGDWESPDDLARHVYTEASAQGEGYA